MHKIVLAVSFAFSLVAAACTPAPGGGDEQMLAASADGYAAVPEVEPADGQPERPIVARSVDEPDAVGMCRSGTSAKITTECQLFEQDSPWRCTCKQGQTVLGHCEQPGGVAIDACQRTCCDR